MTACWYAFSRSVYAYQNGASERLINDGKVCQCATVALAEEIAATHNSAVSVAEHYRLATRIVPGRRETTR